MYVTIKLRCAGERVREEREREKSRHDASERGETKCANKANMRADLQPGGQRYFHEFLEIVGINFSPLFSGESATRDPSLPLRTLYLPFAPDL